MKINKFRSLLSLILVYIFYVYNVILCDIGEGKCGTDESAFNMILASRSIPQLRQTFAEYEAISKKSLEQAIKSEFSGSIEDALLAVGKNNYINCHKIINIYYTTSLMHIYYNFFKLYKSNI
jgi:hypothetical protein